MREGDFVLRRTVLHKLQDVRILKSFTCNEDVLLRILQSTYIEDLEKRCESGDDLPSVMPFLLSAVFYNFRHNLALVTPPRDLSGLAFEFIPPLRVLLCVQ